MLTKNLNFALLLANISAPVLFWRILFHSYLHKYLILLSSTPLLLMFSLSVVGFVLCISQVFSTRSSRFFRYMTIQRLQNLPNVLFFLFFTNCRQICIALIIAFNINSVTSYSLRRRLGLLFKLDGLLGGSSAVSGVSKDFDCLLSSCGQSTLQILS